VLFNIASMGLGGPLPTVIEPVDVNKLDIGAFGNGAFEVAGETVDTDDEPHYGGVCLGGDRVQSVEYVGSYTAGGRLYFANEYWSASTDRSGLNTDEVDLPDARNLRRPDFMHNATDGRAVGIP
jgi:hypothetical protein